jgi:hypothetical protein
MVCMTIDVIGGNGLAVLICDTTYMAFGPVHKTSRYSDAVSEMWEFVETLDQDPREMSPELLRDVYHGWLRERLMER